jgi:hypothetical protein
MNKITLGVNKSCPAGMRANQLHDKTFGTYLLGKYRYPVERSAVLGILAKFPGITSAEIANRFQLEFSIIRDVVADLYDSGKILIDISGRIFLAEGGV